MFLKHTHLWECKVNEEISLYEHSNESIEINTLNTNDEKGNQLLIYNVLILEASYHDVWVECNGTLYRAPINYLWAVMPSFGKGGGSRTSHEMWQSGILGMGLFICPSVWTYTANIGIWRGSIPMYASMFWVTLAGDSTFFLCGGDTGFYDAHMIYVG